MNARIIIVFSDCIYYFFLQIFADWFGVVDHTGTVAIEHPLFFAINLISIFAILKIPPEEFHIFILWENVFILIVK